jgi:hypothetical protein
MTELTLTENDYKNMYKMYENFYKIPNSNGKIKLKDLGTDIFYYGDKKHDAIFAKYKPDKDPENPNKRIIKLKTRAQFLDLYDDLLNVEHNLHSDNYVVIDISGICYKSDSVSNDLTFLYKCIENNIFGIEYMLRRYYKKQKDLHIYNNEFFFNINSQEAFEEIFFDKLIDDLFNPDMYVGGGRITTDVRFTDAIDNVIVLKIKPAYADEFNTSINISNRLEFYIRQIYNPLLAIYNDNDKYIFYSKYDYIKVKGEHKKIFVIGDIHGDFARLVQILYNSGFIRFEGVEWNKVDLSNESEYKKYLHSTDIFKEIKWVAKDTILLFAGDLVDSTGRSVLLDADDETGDYELRIHLMILILRRQAMKDNNSFVHYVIGNHDKYDGNFLDSYVGNKSANKLFNSLINRKHILGLFTQNIYFTYYLLISYTTDNYIVLAHGSFNFDMGILNKIKNQEYDKFDITATFYGRNIKDDIKVSDDQIHTDTQLFKKYSNLDNKKINFFVFGHSIVHQNDIYINYSKIQTNLSLVHTILSTANNHCFLVDTGLSKAFDDNTINNEFYELLYLNSKILAANNGLDSYSKDKKASAHLRVYTDGNRFRLGSRQAELFYDTNAIIYEFTPILEDIGVPIGDLLLS